MTAPYLFNDRIIHLSVDLWLPHEKGPFSKNHTIMILFCHLFDQIFWNGGKELLAWTKQYVTSNCLTMIEVDNFQGSSYNYLLSERKDAHKNYLIRLSWLLYISALSCYKFQDDIRRDDCLYLLFCYVFEIPDAKTTLYPYLHSPDLYCVSP